MMPYRGYAHTYLEFGTRRCEVVTAKVEKRGGYDHLYATTVEGTTITGVGRVTIDDNNELGPLTLKLVHAPHTFIVESCRGTSPTNFYDGGEIIDGTARPAPPMLPDTVDDK